MRKLFLSLSFLITFSGLVKSQMWLDVGLKGGWGPTILINSNAFDDQNFIHKFSYGHMFGGKLGLNFNDDHEITLDVMGMKYFQKYDYNIADSTTGGSTQFHKSVSFNVLCIGLLYRHNKDGRHFEVGPVYNIVQKAALKDDNPLNSSQVSSDVKSNLVSGYMSMLFGFGGYFLGTENFGITLGARFIYGFGDLISEKGKSTHFPYEQSYPNYKNTAPFSAMLVAEANLDFAFWAKAKCKNKRKLILF